MKTPAATLPADKIPTPTTSPRATENKSGTPVPQTVAHRGYKGKYPENSVAAFKGAIEAGANGIETDLRISRDGVVVLVHDKTLERCFGVKKLVSDCDWSYLQTLKSTQDPQVGIPRLVDLLEVLVQPGAEDVWALLDIKASQLDNPPSIMKKIADDLATVTSSIPWANRLVLGVWSASYIPACETYLPNMPIAIICFDASYARQFLRIPNANIGFNINQKIIMGPLGRGFLEEAKGKGRAVYAWTVNERNLMGWCVRKGVDGIVTDFPEIARELAEGSGGKDGEGMQEK
ncbi:glycerophosphoryl diester phosphodiesterase, partial [Aspergillus sclerotialis]